MEILPPPPRRIPASTSMGTPPRMGSPRTGYGYGYSMGGGALDSIKSSKLLIREHPHRSIAIVSETHSLIFRYSRPQADYPRHNGNNGFSAASGPSPRSRSADSGPARCMVEFSPTTLALLQHYRPLTPRPIFGTLGLISVNGDVFICVITQATKVATLRPGETIERIAMVEFFCLNTNEHDDVLSADPYGRDDTIITRGDQGLDHPCVEVQKLLSNGSFYYSTDFDVTNRLQDRPADASSFNIDNFDDSFLWNSYMISPLVQFRSRLLSHEREALDASRILTSAIRGFCNTLTVPQSSAPLSREADSGMPSYLTVISRLSCRRAGTRFNSRGIDDDGNVANFVETETIYWSPCGVVFSYAQVRGSVPVFWEQTAAFLPGQQKIAITRSPDGTQPAFDKHFDDLERTYGAVHVVNLLSESKPGEVELSQAFRFGIQHCPLSRPGEKGSQRDHALLMGTEYDFHAETSGPSSLEAAKGIRRYIQSSAKGFAYYFAKMVNDADDTAGRYGVELQQEGVFRTNCLDCLDRTNLIQAILSQMALEAFLDHCQEEAMPDFWSRHASLWADNGDSLSKIYAGTGALKSSFTRHGKISLSGMVADARKSATRLYINNFVDKGRQNTIDMLLGRLYGQVPVLLYDPISDYVVSELAKRSDQFTSSQVISIWVGTFNLNGRPEGINEDLSPWLCPPVLGQSQPEIVVVGFQEIVELNTQQIMNSDPRPKQLWEQAVKRTLNQNAAKVGGERYVLLRSGQLVGAALCIFVRASALHNIKNVEGSIKKTGMSGMAGNKGAVAIRLDYANTQLCFVTAHLAAGFANYDERNRDYATIHHGLRFQRNRSIDDHDTVVWLGDFNYRIGLNRETALDLVKRRDLETLYENDQLNLQMVAGLSFPFYSEARITFLPTYKFDLGKDEYDSSEKARIPAWTDRILRKGTNIRQLAYDSAPLRFSDHRPVYATFECIVSIVDEAVRERISKQLYERRKSEAPGAANISAVDDTDEEDLMGYDSIEPGLLPAASSDRQKWWLDNGKMAQSSVSAPRPIASTTRAVVLNADRPPNPFVPTDEADWVQVPRAESRLSSFSSLSTSPYEHIHQSLFLPASSSSPHLPPRKLPPPFDPTASSGSPSAKSSPGAAKIAAVGSGGRPKLLDAGGGSGGADSLPQKKQEREAPPPIPPPRRQANNTSILTPHRAATLPAARPQPALATKIIPPPERKTIPQPTPPPPRPASAASATSSTTNSPLTPKAGKAPPPVARKPAHLTSVSPSASPTVHQSAEMTTVPRTKSPSPAVASMRESAARLDSNNNNSSGANMSSAHDSSTGKGTQDFSGALSDVLSQQKKMQSQPQFRQPPTSSSSQEYYPIPGAFPVRRSATDNTRAAGLPPGAISLAGMTATTTPPALPVRKPTLPPPPPQQKPQQPPLQQEGPPKPRPKPKPKSVSQLQMQHQPQPHVDTDLLGDEGGAELSGWEALKPNT